MHALLCTLLLLTYPHAEATDAATAFDVCRGVSMAAEDRVPASLALSLSYWESKFHPSLINPVSGASGPLQILAKWTCEGGTWAGCGDLVDEGIGAMQQWYKLVGRRGGHGLALSCTHWVWHLEAGPLRQGLWLRVIEGYTGSEDSGNYGHARQVVNTAMWLERAVECSCSPRMRR